MHVCAWCRDSQCAVCLPRPQLTFMRLQEPGDSSSGGARDIACDACTYLSGMEVRCCHPLTLPCMGTSAIMPRESPARAADCDGLCTSST